MNGFFNELKRRNVIRMAGLYLVGAWLLVQVAGTVLPMFSAPDWLPRTIVILLAIGFVPALSADLAARVYARFGDKKRAIASLERVLSAPCDGFFGVPLTPAILRLDPDFDSLRGDPDFQKLLEPTATDEKGAPR